MRLAHLAVAAMTMVAPTFASASSSYVVPTTTLTAQTSNNTSAANGFTTQSNNNRGAGNISKVDVHTLLYPGTTTKIYAHMVLWFGQSSHMNIGYSETNPVQVQSQIDDMVSRGIDGVIIDWYGPNNSIDEATQLVMAAAESHPGFTFAIMIDQGAIQWYSCQGCSLQQALVNDLQYIEHTYFPSPAYMTIQGQPVVTNFNVDLSYPSVDWNAANAALSTHPRFIFQNNNGFTHVLTDGSYSWVMPTTNDYGMGYLGSFYDAGLSYPNEETVGATYKGFNDTLASWGSNRIMGQQCGQTWLETFSKLNGMYSAEKQLPYLQLVTWNDYEEATEIESGIDNCLTMSASVSANSLQWTSHGNENTVDHYTVYIS
ncbi:MAG: endo-1,3-alpha-glucanase family glycosylhydrolase, partial [Candidatus Sulfotelmatobacter sp.]